VGLVAAFLGALAVCLGPSAVRDAEGNRQPPGRAFTGLLLASLALWGLFWNASSTASLAIFADSVPQGATRREVFATKSTVTLLALGLGPLLALLSTSLVGNSWRLEQMVWVILPGFVVMLPLCGLLACFEDVGLPFASASGGDGKGSPLLQDVGGPPASNSPSQAAGDQKNADKNADVDQPKGSWAVPYLLL
ncbi:unnamed protein product, partial [Polarella glacialis]